MRNINLRYVDETYAPDGQLETFSVHYPDNFNFGYDVVDDIAMNDPDRRAMIWCNPEGEEHIFTFADMKRWSDKTANFLVDQGIKRGDYVLVVLRRHYQFWFVATALAKIGAVMVPATFMLKEHDLEYRLNGASISSIICTSVGEISQIADNVIDECPTVTSRILVNGAGGGTTKYDDEGNLIAVAGTVGAALSGEEGICAASIERKGWADFNSGVRAASEVFERRDTAAADPMLMYFSSGTSGNPKMVLHNSGYAVAHLITAKHWHNVQPDGVHFTIADTGWGKAVWGKYYGQWLMEACVLTYDFDRFNAGEILSLISKYQVTTLCCPPTMYRLMMSENFDAYDLSSLQYSTTAGEALNPDLFNFWKEHTGLTIFEGFGQTETPLTIANLKHSTPRSGSMGKPVPLYDVEIQRDDGSRCNTGETGEICIRMEPRPAGIMMEYYRDPEKTANAIYDGWYHTGDTAWVDEDGYFWYVGRNDDVIKSSGYRIGPFEIESELLEHEAVRECAVTGVPDPVRGFAVKATVVLADGFKGSDELTRELQAWVKHRTAPYKYPRIVEYVDALPKTVNGKIRRVAIRQKDGADLKSPKLPEGLI
ncbi:MAG: AMP-binding protein [Ellagibacter isourolithinifaciens]|uniref:AMP-binding protein n=1 Tax=Ellagibacter isourolithinifaciens TaxID=2137581 RepID=UPI0023F4FF0C|nr:AMP-binding protein [Ellagibacter isourolithinifaciens]MDD7689974.1 AMP-binding protein [Ellagibacter isourolithinifaciens]